MLDAVCCSMDMSNAGAGSLPDLAQVGEAELELDTQRPCLFCCYSHQCYKLQDSGGKQSVMSHNTWTPGQEEA